MTELGTLLAGAGLGLTLGTNLFYGPLPEDPDAQVCVALVASPVAVRPSERRFGAAALAYEWPRTQVLTRGLAHDGASALTMARAVYAFLGTVEAQDVGGVLIHEVRCLQPPGYLKRDANGRDVYVFNVETEKRL